MRQVTVGPSADIRRFVKERGKASWEDIVAQFPEHGDKIKHVLSYLCGSTHQLEKFRDADSQEKYRVTGDYRPRITDVPKGRDSGYIGLLLDDEKVILTVEGKTLEMSPSAFTALRRKLRTLD